MCYGAKNIHCTTANSFKINRSRKYMPNINIAIGARWGTQTVPAVLHDSPNHVNHNEIMEYGNRSKYWKWIPAGLRPVDLKLKNEPDSWNWHRRISRAMNSKIAKTWVLECQVAKNEGYCLTQGLIVFQRSNSFLYQNIDVIYINLLGVAPHVRRFGWWKLSWPGKYRRVKINLLDCATQESVTQNLGGTISLFAEPGTERFYSRMGLTRTKVKDGPKTYFEGVIKPRR